MGADMTVGGDAILVLAFLTVGVYTIGIGASRASAKEGGASHEPS
jgi:hypothetical protein